MKNNIFLLITNLGIGGAQRVFAEQALMLKEKYTISEVVFDAGESEDVYKTGNLQYSLHTAAGKNSLDKVAKMFKRADNLKRLIAAHNASLCISHMDGANWVNVLSRARAKKILVVHGTILHDHTINPRLRQIRQKWIIPLLYKKADKVVAVSEGIKNELTTFCGLKNVLAIPNAFDREAILKKAAEPLSEAWESIFAENRVLITSGRLHEQKKQRYLLPLLKELQQKTKGLKLVIMGDGPLRADLLSEAAALGLRCYNGWNPAEALTPDYDIYFPGYISNPFQFLKRSTVFLFPSGWEGFPLALCEAMIAGVPVLAADCPTGPREIIAPGTFDAAYTLRSIEETEYGYLLPMTDKQEFEETWAKAIMDILDNSPKRAALIANGKERMKAYDKAVVMQQWFSVIDKVLSK